MSYIPQVLSLIEDLDIVHVVLAVYAGLDLEQSVRISQVRLHSFRDLVRALEQLRIDLLECLSDRIRLVHDVEVYCSVVCIHYDLDRVPDVVGRVDLISVRL